MSAWGRGIGLFVFLSTMAAAACSGEEAATQSAGSAGTGGSSSTTSSTTTGSTSTTGSSSTATSASSSSGSQGGAGGSGQGGSGGQGGAGGQGGGAVTAASCFADDFVNPPQNGPDYDQFAPVIGSHCMGTNHQDITGIERVVFLGDSVTVGTPPSLSGQFYRSILADALAAKFGLAAPNLLWQSADIFNGTSIVQESGDFASCAKWGARTDDLIQDSTQIADCFSPSDLQKRTLVVMTMGGNDLAALTKDASNGVPQADLWLETQAFVDLLRGAVQWFYEPGRFPNGVFVVFGNMYEFTDGTGEVQACDVSGLAGFDQPVPSPQDLAAMVVWANEQYMSIAVESQADMIFMLEDFCGHGFNADNPAAPCYRGPGNATWFDLTCIHPNPTGHQHIADMFMAVVDE